MLHVNTAAIYDEEILRCLHLLRLGSITMKRN